MTPRTHVPVLLEEALALLDNTRPGTYIDGTIGMGGHAAALLERNPAARLIGFDLDESALDQARVRLAPYADRATLYHADFRNLTELDLEFDDIRGALFDLGFSSDQLDNPERGFSYSQDGPLDMRMDRRGKNTAARLLNKSSEPKLAEIFFRYGELRQSRKLARAIVSRRKVRKLETTRQLFQIVEDVCRWRPQKGKSHPAARVFQAIRIEVNQELNELAPFLERLIKLLPGGARVVAISFHSLEDRIVKHVFADLASDRDGPAYLRLLTKKPVLPSPEETARNFRSRSAKLRGGERL